MSKRQIVEWQADPRRADGTYPGTFTEVLECGHKGHTVKSLSGRHYGKRSCAQCERV